MIADFPTVEVPQISEVTFERFVASAGSSPTRQYRRLVLGLG